MVDPPHFPIAKETFAARRTRHIAWTFDSDSHSDYMTGRHGLQTRVGSTFVAPAASHLETPHRAIGDGDSINHRGGLTMTAL